LKKKSFTRRMGEGGGGAAPGESGGSAAPGGGGKGGSGPRAIQRQLDV
jgi:hypothetical protein